MGIFMNMTQTVLILLTGPVTLMTGMRQAVHKVTKHSNVDTKRKIYLIDDEGAKGWEAVFDAIFKKIFHGMVEFHWLEFGKENTLTADAYYHTADSLICDSSRAETLFILDNRFGDERSLGLKLLGKWGSSQAIIMHSADKNIAFQAAKSHALFFMPKDDPQCPMGEKEIKEMITEQSILDVVGIHLET